MTKADKDTIITLYLRYGHKGILVVIANFLAGRKNVKNKQYGRVGENPVRPPKS